MQSLNINRGEIDGLADDKQRNILIVLINTSYARRAKTALEI